MAIDGVASHSLHLQSTVGQGAFYAQLFEAVEARGFYRSAWEWMSM